jgi:hypothetical protein
LALGYYAALGSGALGAGGTGISRGNTLVGSSALGGQGGGLLLFIVDVFAHAVADAGTGCAPDEAAHRTVALVDEGTAQDTSCAPDGGAFALRAPAALGLSLVARNEAEQQHRNEE